MSNYRRLISYIYAYEGGVKGKNIGFAKLEVRNDQCKLSVNVKKVYVGGNNMGVYLLAGKREVFLGNIFIRNGAGEFRAIVQSGNVENTGTSIDECYGLTVHEVENAWQSYTTIWEDAVARAAQIDLADVTSENITAIPQTAPGFPKPAAAGIEREIELNEQAADAVHNPSPEEMVPVPEKPMVLEGIVSVPYECIKAGKERAAGERPASAPQAVTAVPVQEDMYQNRGDGEETGKESIVQDSIVRENIAQDAIFEPVQQGGPEDWEAQDQAREIQNPAQQSQEAQNQAQEAQNQAQAAQNQAQLAQEAQNQVWQAQNQTQEAQAQAREGQQAWEVQNQAREAQQAQNQAREAQNQAQQSQKAQNQAQQAQNQAREIQNQAQQSQKAQNQAQEAQNQAQLAQQSQNQVWQSQNQTRETQAQARQAQAHQPQQSQNQARESQQARETQPQQSQPQQSQQSPLTSGFLNRLAALAAERYKNRPIMEEMNRITGRASQEEEPAPIRASANQNLEPAWELGRETETQPHITNQAPPHIYVGDPSELEALEKEEKEESSHEKLWEYLKKVHTKMPAFDYEHGCEIVTIKPQDIGILPRETWVYGNNSFLLHGYYNYRYLILAKLFNPDGKPRYLLGIPGHYYSNEKYMASMFGFPNFVLAKQQPAEDGRFGFWYTDVRLGN